MDLLDRFLGHDAWTTRQLLQRCLGLDEEQLDREFCVGPRTVRATLTHSMHHRAQLLHMLRRLGLEGLPEGDLLGWERQAR